ncbi:epidermal growth factor-like protein 6 isoform X2 [Dendropsophus ebraccatus]|uniref:epidermal growth factor-like protein 6 isoform X2 n=1 Tax=Dendropsophus ebraccatus TaxID=150705 RepID=UPI003831B918
MWLLLWITILGVYFTSAAGRFAESSRRLRRLIPSPNTQGLCRYGTKTECCYGWKRNSKGQCEDLNECGLKPRPCEHRCMNTHGSYKCYCLNGYMLMPDGSCSNSRTCAMSNCQYGCEEVKGEVRCLCPSSGLQLGPDGRSCIDIDECATGKALCHFNRRCVNTFGSYYCKCQHGFDLKYVNGRYDCLDINECLVGTHKCSPHSDCLNTPGSYKCRCKQGYKGSGYVCSAIPDKPVKESPKIIGSAKDTIKKLLAHKNSLKRNEEMKNLIPEPIITPSPKTRLQPFDYVDGVYIGGTYHEENEEFEHNEDEEEEEEEEEDDEDDDYDNGIGQEKILRGDVFALQVKREEPAFRSSVISQKATSLNSEEVSIDCSFDRGACDWKQETEDDFDWKHTNRSHGTGFYLSVPATAGHKKAVGRLRLPLTNLRTNSKSCLIFTYHLFGEKFGKLRVYMNENSDPIWEENRSNNKGWRIARVEIPETHDISSSKIIFESERGKGNHGEMALDNVFLVSGPCTED